MGRELTFPAPALTEAGLSSCAGNLFLPLRSLILPAHPPLLSQLLRQSFTHKLKDLFESSVSARYKRFFILAILLLLLTHYEEKYSALLFWNPKVQFTNF